MIKMRLQGTRNDIRWFLKILEKDDRFDVVDTSDMYSIKTSNRYRRLYTNIFRKKTSTLQFVVTFPNMNYGVIAEGDYSNREQDKEQDKEQDVIQVGCKTLTQIIEYCKVPKSRAELQEYCGLKGRRNFGKNHLTPLLEKGVLKMTIPDKPTSKNQKYYSV